MSKRNDILTAIKAALVSEVAALDAAHVHIGAIPIQQLDGSVRCGLFPAADAGEHHEGRSTREMTIALGVFIAIDDSQSESQMEQLWDAYDLIHAAMETISLDAGAVNALQIRENESGVEAAGLDDRDNVVYAASAWTVKYRRDYGSA